MALSIVDDFDVSAEDEVSLRHTQMETVDVVAGRAASVPEAEVFCAEIARGRESMRKKVSSSITRSQKRKTPATRDVNPPPVVFSGSRITRSQKRKTPATRDVNPPPVVFSGSLWNRAGLPVHFLFEFACGYALFHFKEMNKVGLSFESAEKYIKCPDQVFKLEAYHRFPSATDALAEMNALSESKVTEQLKIFLQQNLPKPINGKPSYYVAAACPWLGTNISIACRMPTQCGVAFFNIIRGLRMNIDKLIPGFKPGELEKAQQKLALLYSRQRCNSCHRGNSSSSSLLEAVIMPHRFEGIFTSMVKEENFICTKNLVPGEAFCDEELISHQNEDGTEVEYRVWNPLRSKLAAAILCGVNNIWVKPGSRVLCLGVCSITISHLSDLVGPYGVVYAVGLSDRVVNMAEKRSNVIPIFGIYIEHWKYRVVVGMVDFIYADVVDLIQVNSVSTNASRYLRAGGNYMMSIPESLLDSTDQGKKLFTFRPSEFKVNELVKLEPIDKGHVMVVGGFRVLEE